VLCWGKHKAVDVLQLIEADLCCSCQWLLVCTQKTCCAQLWGLPGGSNLGVFFVYYWVRMCSGCTLLGI
jgi:hypothetical protein